MSPLDARGRALTVLVAGVTGGLLRMQRRPRDTGRLITTSTAPADQ